MNYNLFWIRVQRILKLRNLSEILLAKHINVSAGTLRYWIYWNQIPDVIVACRVSEFLEVSVEYLVFGKDYVKKRINADLTKIILFPHHFHLPEVREELYIK